ncbi:glycosyltransferase family 2 protein [Phosphitispora sp. TUW77]|uniref:glycosyltransferase family 2 protein n=1 Tax=Phosphitispora sp. TUW77 TaxID=3152361 RepID=UPI003AB5D854
MLKDTDSILKDNSVILKDKRVLVIIPAFNEERNLPGIIGRVREFAGIDVIVINDGSEDATSAVARAAGAKVIDLPFNLGIGGAVQTGYLFAHKNDYDVAIQVDADGQHNPEDLLRIIGPVISGEADMVLGSRYVAKTGYKTPFARKIGMLVFSTVVSLINKQPLKDTTSGYRAVSKRVIRFFVDNYPTDYPEVEALVLLKKSGFSIKEVPVTMAPREYGKSSITPIKSIYYMIKVLLAIFMNLLRAHKKEA